LSKRAISFVLVLMMIFSMTPAVYAEEESQVVFNAPQTIEGVSPAGIYFNTTGAGEYEYYGNEDNRAIVEGIFAGTWTFNQNIVLTSGGVYYEPGHDYIYGYNMTDLGLSIDESQDGWLVISIDLLFGNQSKTTFEEMYASLLGKPIKNLTSTFDGMHNMIEAPSIPSSVTVMNRTFYGCSSLTEAPIIPEGVQDMSQCFRDCSGLEGTVDIPSSVTSLNEAFAFCSSLSAVTGTLTGTVDMVAAFKSCESLTTVPAIQDATIISLEETFDGCTSLVNAPVLPDTVENMDQAFFNCASLEEAPQLPSSVTDLTYAFSSCSALTVAPTIPYGVITMSAMFENCTSLETAPELPETVKDLYNAFSHCSNLEIPPEIPAGATDIRGMFQYCKSLKRTPSSLPDGISSIANLFTECDSLNEVDLVLPAGVTNLDNAFWRCSNLYSITIGKAESDAYITSFLDTFKELPKLKELDVRGWEIADGFTEYNTIRYFFYDTEVERVVVSKDFEKIFACVEGKNTGSVKEFFASNAAIVLEGDYSAGIPDYYPEDAVFMYTSGSSVTNTSSRSAILANEIELENCIAEVTSGTGTVIGDTLYAVAGSVVSISPKDLSGDNLQFKDWESLNGTVDNANSSTTSITIGAGDGKITATYEEKTPEEDGENPGPTRPSRPKPSKPVEPVEPVLPSTGEKCDGTVASGCHGAEFIDINTDAWYHEAVDYVIEKGIMNGMGGSYFVPNDDVTRAQVVTMLYRLEGSPAVGSDASFKDIPADEWYTDAVAWASQNGIVNGFEDGSFFPARAITREQMTAIFCRYADYKGLNIAAEDGIDSFSDADKVSTYATDSMNWAVESGLINGTYGKLMPKDDTTRVQAAAIIMRYCEEIAE